MAAQVLSAGEKVPMVAPLSKSVAVMEELGIAGIFVMSQQTCLHSMTVSTMPAVLVLVDNVLCLYALTYHEVRSRSILVVAIVTVKWSVKG